MRGERAGCQPPCDSAALQQHQRAVPEQLGMTSDPLAGSRADVHRGTVHCKSEERITPGGGDWSRIVEKREKRQ